MKAARRILMSGRQPEILRRLQRRLAAGAVDAEADAAGEAEARERRARAAQMPAVAKVEGLVGAEEERGRRREL
jgi:hypothetical protein